MSAVGKASLESVRDDMEYLAEAWPYVVSLKLPGTAKAWTEKPRKGVLSEADLERMGAAGVPRQAPANVGVLDLLQMTVSTTVDVVRTLSAVLGDENPGAVVSMRDIRPALRWIARTVEDANVVDEQSIPWTGFMFDPITAQTAYLLGDVRSGQTMNAICPWCGGQTGSHKGERTMQIHYPNLENAADEPLILCQGLGCAPPSSACGMRWRGYPAWPRREWDWLSTELASTTRKAAIG